VQLEAKTNLLVVAELVSILEVQGHPAISSSCSLRKEIKLPAWTMINDNNGQADKNAPNTKWIRQALQGCCIRDQEDAKMLFSSCAQHPITASPHISAFVSGSSPRLLPLLLISDMCF
jgi:hypothetical protein